MFDVRDLIPWREKTAKGRVPAHFMDPFENLHREVNRLFGEAWRGFGMSPIMRFADWRADLTPSMDVHEDKDAYTVSLELPGMTEEDIEVILRDKALTIRGEKKEERTEGEEGSAYRYTERSYGTFTRSIPILDDVNPENVTAAFKDGVLTVTLKKTEEAKRKYRRIEVETDSGEEKSEKKIETKAA